MSWASVQLSSVADIVRGVTYKKHQAEKAPQPGLLPLLRATNVDDRLDTSDGLLYVPENLVKDRQRLQKGDIVLASSSGSLSVVGKSAILEQDWGGTFGAFCAVIRSSPEVEPRFLSHYLRSHAVRSRWSEAARGTNINNLKRGDLEQTPVPLPPLYEQRRIVDVLEDLLSRLDAAALGLATARKRLAALERSALDKHFGDGPSVLLQDLVEGISAGKSYGGSNAPAQDDEWGIIKVSAMTWGEFRPEENKAVPTERADSRYEIREGDLLVSRANTSDYVGASVLVGQVRPRLLLSDKSLRVTPKPGVNVEWLWRALQAPSARRQMSALATGTKDSMRNISQASLRSVRLPKVDEKAQAQALEGFTAQAAATARLRVAAERSEARQGQLRRALLAAAFSGRLTGNVSDLSAAKEVIDA